MSRRFQLAANISITTLFIAFGLAMLTLILPTGWKIFSVQSGSMEPALSTGDLVLVHSIPASEYRIGDVITYMDPSNPKQTITHRIAEIKDGQQRVFVTKGDANHSADRAFNEAMVVGKQEVAVPVVGRAVDFLFTIPGLLIVIWLPALWLIFGETKRLADYYRRIRPYIAPEITASRLHQPRHHGVPLAVFAVVGTAVLVLGVAAPALAATSNMVRLSGNVIGIQGSGVPPEPPDDGGHTVTCTNNTNVNIHSQTNQHAQSGNAVVQGNTNGGSATSGNASNASSTNVNISVNNGSCVPQPQPGG